MLNSLLIGIFVEQVLQFLKQCNDTLLFCRSPRSTAIGTSSLHLKNLPQFGLAMHMHFFFHLSAKFNVYRCMDWGLSRHGTISITNSYNFVARIIIFFFSRTPLLFMITTFGTQDITMRCVLPPEILATYSHTILRRFCRHFHTVAAHRYRLW